MSPATDYKVLAYNKTSVFAQATVNIQVNLPPAPTISYSTPQTLVTGTAVTLSPTSSGVFPAAYNANPVILGSGFLALTA